MKSFKGSPVEGSPIFLPFLTINHKDRKFLPRSFALYRAQDDVRIIFKAQDDAEITSLDKYYSIITL